MLKHLIALVGPSGAGKTSIITAIAQRHPNDMVILRSLTSRERRANDPNEDTFYEFCSAYEILRTPCAESVFYDGRYYALSRAELKQFVDGPACIAIIALTEAGVMQLRDDHDVVLSVVNVDRTKVVGATPTRETEDAKRKVAWAGSHPPDFTVLNNGPLVQAVDTLDSYVQKLIW